MRFQNRLSRTRFQDGSTRKCNVENGLPTCLQPEPTKTITAVERSLAQSRIRRYQGESVRLLRTVKDQPQRPDRKGSREGREACLRDECGRLSSNGRVWPRLSLHKTARTGLNLDRQRTTISLLARSCAERVHYHGPLHCWNEVYCEHNRLLCQD